MHKKANLKGLSVLVIEKDDASLREIVRSLQEIEADVHSALNANIASRILSQHQVSVIVADLDMIDEQCIQMIKEYKSNRPDVLFYVLADPAYDSVESSQESVRLIVDDYIKKPLDVQRFAAMVETSIGRPSTASKSLTIIDPIIEKVKPYFLLRSPLMKQALKHIPQISVSGQTVLITGETGTGKELVARVLHVLSRNASGPFVPINCGAVPESLIEGELFGHEKGAFTGAVRTRKGKFETATNGTLFLDEIGDMPLNLQVRLLRVLEEGSVYRIGGERPIPINVRVIAASNTDLLKAVSNGLFREDLYYRLSVLRMHLPPLRERVEDIPLLAVHFIERAFAEMGWQPPHPHLSSESIYMLERYPWKGNVRELRNVMTRIATLLPRNTKRIFPFHVRPHLDEGSQMTQRTERASEDSGVFIPFGTDLRNVEELLIRKTLDYTNGNRTRTASLLGVSLRNLRRKLNK